MLLPQPARAKVLPVGQVTHLFDNVRHHVKMGEAEVNAFLTHLAVKEKLNAWTPKRALLALLFLYGHVLGREAGGVSKVIGFRKPTRLPTVMTRDEVKAVLANSTGAKWLMASLMDGSGLGWVGCLRLRFQDVHFSRNGILVPDGKGAKERVRMLPG